MAKECSNSSCSKESCEGCPSRQPQSFKEEMNQFSNIKHVIGIVSGKGGVGKSFVTASLANQMAKQGYKVGILDADITGPSIPRMYGLKGPAQAEERGIYPMVSQNGIGNVQILSPQRKKGTVCANRLNSEIRDLVNPPRAGRAEIKCGGMTYRVGDRVIQTRNQEEAAGHLHGHPQARCG